MKYIEAIEKYDVLDHQQDVAVFLAGGITGCKDWQAEMVKDLNDVNNLVILNPRRKNFPIKDPNAAEEQIKWEFDHMRLADVISFWFSPETLNPIVLYELGRWAHSDKPIFVGVHPDYKRKQDVVIQTHLARPEIKLVYSSQNLCNMVRDYVEGI